MWLLSKFVENAFSKAYTFCLYVLLIQWLASVGSAEAVHVGREAVGLFRLERTIEGQVLCGEKESLKQSVLVEWTLEVRVETLAIGVWDNLWMELCWNR